MELMLVLMSALRCVYWFNPLVWVSFSAMQTDMEVACDAGVMERIGAEESFYRDTQDAFIFPNTQGFHDAIAPLRTASIDYLTNCLKKRDSK